MTNESYTLTLEQLDAIFSALSSDTRKQVIREIDKAQMDTCVEYHRSIDITAQRLFDEVQALRVGINSLKRVDKEYDEITRNDRHNSPDNIEGLENNEDSS